MVLLVATAGATGSYLGYRASRAQHDAVPEALGAQEQPRDGPPPRRRGLPPGFVARLVEAVGESFDLEDNGSDYTHHSGDGAEGKPQARGALSSKRRDAGEDENEGLEQRLAAASSRLRQVVVWPLTAEEVQRIVAVCYDASMPMVPFGSGTSLEGHVTAPMGGVCINLSRMRRILQLNEDDADCVVEPGISWNELNDQLQPRGLFFAPDPGPGASIGGMIGTQCSGPNAVRYGTMADNVVSLEVVLAQPGAPSVRTGQRAKKSSAGYDLTRLIVGSEGTLGIVTKATLRLRRIPECLAVTVCSFPTLRDAAAAVADVMREGIQVGRAELLDEVMVQAINNFSGTTRPVQPLVLFQLGGRDASVQDDVARVAAIAAKNGATVVESASHGEERDRLWQARKDALFAAMQMRPGCSAWATDVCVPLSQLTECISRAKADSEELGVYAPIVAHAGDGNFHLIMVVNKADAGEMERVQTLNTRLVLRAIDMGGTCTGEHGIGVGKRAFLPVELGAEAVRAMRDLKRALDPRGLMNPGKVFLDP